MPKAFIKILFVIFALSAAVLAQNPVTWSLESSAKGKTLKAGEAISATLKAKIEDGWHLYSLDQPKGGPVATSIKLDQGQAFEINGEFGSPKSVAKADKITIAARVTAALALPVGDAVRSFPGLESIP